MDPTTIAAAVRRFPLTGRPRPACPSLAERVTDVAAIAAQAAAGPEDMMAKAAHALNLAALIASDCGMPDLARRWCWRHINVYRRLDALTILHASYLLEPVLNLARLQIRAGDGQPTLDLLRAMYQAVTANHDLTVDGQRLPMANLTGPQDELRRLHQWAWMQYVTEGIRIHTLAGRWPEAVRHASSLRGIGLHLMEGRQADIVAHLLDDDPDQARTVLHGSTITEAWEQQVASCLAAMCSQPSARVSTLDAMIDRFRAPYESIEGYAVYRIRWGLTTVTLAAASHPATAQDLLYQVATEALDAADGYAAREVYGYRTTLQLDPVQQAALDAIVKRAALGEGSLLGDASSVLTDAVAIAELALAAAVGLAEQNGQ
ncbi:hypothetical protein [Hamadaea tsunoensis]|uniref:hypothetical protein n=1 Tax=Hamadaea tsunoensis TaxID=53368 RepID=UPI00041465EE|nr:hypothetical protein [Hamadaea tsunoensis]